MVSKELLRPFYFGHSISSRHANHPTSQALDDGAQLLNRQSREKWKTRQSLSPCRPWQVLFGWAMVLKWSFALRVCVCFYSKGLLFFSCFSKGPLGYIPVVFLWPLMLLHAFALLFGYEIPSDHSG